MPVISKAVVVISILKEGKKLNGHEGIYLFTKKNIIIYYGEGNKFPYFEKENN